MLDDIAGTYGSRLFVAAGGVAVALLVLVAVLWLVRNRAPSPFVRGGKGRQQRLQVLDAAAIDARRRIVLIRRDGVEHLVMIGGPTDIVIETGIGDPSKLPISPAAIAASAPPEAISGIESARSSPQLDAPRAAPRVDNRQAEPSSPLTPPPVQAAIEAPLPPRPERPPQPEKNPAPIVTTGGPAIEPAFLTTPVELPQLPEIPTQSTAAVQPPSVERVASNVEREQVAVAADILDAARQRVLLPERVPDVIVSPAPTPTNPTSPAPILVQDAYKESYEVSVPEITPPRKLGTEFEGVLDAEMANALTAEPVVQSPQSSPVSPLPGPVAPPRRRDPDVAPIAGGDEALQKEVARIFGEMSGDRDKP